MIIRPRFSLSYLRTRTTEKMDHTCRINRPGSYTDNDLTGIASYQAGAVVYEGPCRFWEAQGGSGGFLGEEQVKVTQTFLSIPWSSPVPEEDDVITILTHVDPDMVGRTVQVEAMTRGGDLRASRVFRVKITTHLNKAGW